MPARSRWRTSEMRLSCLFSMTACTDRPRPGPPFGRMVRRFPASASSFESPDNNNGSKRSFQKGLRLKQYISLINQLQKRGEDQEHESSDA